MCALVRKATTRADKKRTPLRAQAKRGDTIIEVMFAFAIFSFIAVLTVSMMNSTLATSERSLELVTARNELNAQAEALRFIHSSYISELTLPTCESLTPPLTPANTPCQKYAALWDKITDNAMRPSSASPVVGTEYSVPSPLDVCKTAYDPAPGMSRTLLQANNAFVINTRQLIPSHGVVDSSRLASAYVSSNGPASSLFVEPTLNARILYTKPGVSGDSSNHYASYSLTDYDQIARVEGIWVVAVAGTNDPVPPYYDFYIETCWYGSDHPAPTSLDAVIRLYNSEGS